MILPKRPVFNVLIAILHDWLAIFPVLVSLLFAKIPVCAITCVLPQPAPYQAAKMSLQYLGISHFPVLHRQFSSPTRGAFSDSFPSHQDITQDSKDVLIERLNDLALRLSTAKDLEDSAVTAIHSQVDKIEKILRGEENHKKPGHSRSDSEPSKEDIFWGPATPTQSLKRRLPDMSRMNQRPPLSRNFQELSSAKVNELAQAAEDLASRMSVTLEEFQRRKEESDVSSQK